MLPLRPEAKRGDAAWRNTIESVKDLHYGPWLALPIPDFGVPKWHREVWNALARDIAWILGSGTSVLVACTGGHGRTGLAVSILSHLFSVTNGCPITWLRDRYCDGAVETERQARYIYDVLGLGEPPEEVLPLPLTYHGRPGAWYYAGGTLTQLKDVPNED